MPRSQSTLPVSLLVLLALSSSAEAAGDSGVIKELDAEQRTTTILIESCNLSGQLTIDNSAGIAIDSITGQREGIQVGRQSASFTTGDSVRRLSVRSEAPTRRPKPQPKPRPKDAPDPKRAEPAPKRTSASSTASSSLRGCDVLS